MTTPQPNQLPEEVKPPYKISEREPVFPCWLWHVAASWIWSSREIQNANITHWHPDQPAAPTVTPCLTPRPPAPRDAEWALNAAREIIHEAVQLKQPFSNDYLFSTIIVRHAPADSASSQLAAMREERDELSRRLEEQHKLYCEETKRHNETWAKIHAATGYLNKEFKNLPEDLLEAVKEVVFRVTLVELGRNSLQGEVAELRDKRKQLIEKLRESVNDTRELNDLAEALVAERTDLRTQLAAAQSEVGRLTEERDAFAGLFQTTKTAHQGAENEAATLRRERDELDKLLAGGAGRIARERRRHVTQEGYDATHDEEHTFGTIRVVAAMLACQGTDASVSDPLDRDDWNLGRHPLERRLEIAGALLAAELDRLERDSARAKQGEGQP